MFAGGMNRKWEWERNLAPDSPFPLYMSPSTSDSGDAAVSYLPDVIRGCAGAVLVHRGDTWCPKQDQGEAASAEKCLWGSTLGHVSAAAGTFGSAPSSP